MTKPKTMPMDRLRSGKKPYTIRYEAVMDAELARTAAAAHTALEEAESDANVINAERFPERHTAARAKVRTLQAAYDAAFAELAPAVRRFLFRGLHPHEWDELVSANKPTDQQREEHGVQTAYNPDKFPPVLIHACLVWAGTGEDEWPTGDEVPKEPCYTEAEIKALWDDEDWSNAELSGLFEHALEACTTRRVVDLGKARRPTPSRASS